MSGFIFHHIGYATRSIEKTSLFFLSIGYSLSETTFDNTQHVNIAFLKKDGSPLIELVEDINADSPVTGIINRNGSGLYHVCYEVDDINQSIANLRKQNFIPFLRPVPAKALNNRLICFLFHKDRGLVEILQK